MSTNSILFVTSIAICNFKNFAPSSHLLTDFEKQNSRVSLPMLCTYEQFVQYLLLHQPAFCKYLRLIHFTSIPFSLVDVNIILIINIGTGEGNFNRGACTSIYSHWQSAKSCYRFCDHRHKKVEQQTFSWLFHPTSPHFFCDRHLTPLEHPTHRPHHHNRLHKSSP